jgi:hypothetical protein
MPFTAAREKEQSKYICGVISERKERKREREGRAPKREAGFTCVHDLTQFSFINALFLSHSPTAENLRENARLEGVN